MESSIYISRNLINYQDIITWAKSVGFPTMMPEDSLHVTVVYCKRKVDWNLVTRDQPEMIWIDAEDEKEHHRAVHEFDGGACVLEIKCDELTQRSEELRAVGIHSNFPDYRAHITITYQKPDDLDIADIPPYRGPIVLGPEIRKEINDNRDWKAEMKEIDLTTHLTEEALSSFDPDHLYAVFKTSYEDATGVAWSKDKFLRRAADWTFYGDESGFVAFREQASGLRKLVGIAGNRKGIMRGLTRLLEENKPVWGAVSKELATMAQKIGLIAPHTYMGGPTVLKILMSTIPGSVFGGATPRVAADGGVHVEYDDVGSTTKYLVANKPYFRTLLDNPDFRDRLDNKVVIKFLQMILKK